MNPSRRRETGPQGHDNPAEARVLLGSGWWSWFRNLAQTPEFPRAPNDQWLVFWHEGHPHWTIEVRIERLWDGSPSAEELARGATVLTVKDDLCSGCEVFVLPEHIFVQRGKGDLGVLLPHDGRPLAELREDEIRALLSG